MPESCRRFLPQTSALQYTSPRGQRPRDWYGTIPGEGTNYCASRPGCDEGTSLSKALDQIREIEAKLDKCCYHARKWYWLRRSADCADCVDSANCAKLQDRKDQLYNQRMFDKVVE